MKIKWFNSIQSKLVLTLICTILFLLCFSLGLNTVFLPSYYEENQVNKLINIYFDIRQENITNLDKICMDNNLTIYKLDVSDDQNTLYPNYPENLTDEEFKNIENLILTYYISEKEDVIDILKTEKEYIICKMLDPTIQSEYLDLFSRYDDKIIYIRINLEDIDNTVEIANTFLLYVTFLSMFEGSIIMLLISSKFTKPILNLAEITSNMSKLKFDKKYEDNREDEIGILGNSVNLLSERLEENIKELKNANLQLEKDIREKEQIDEMRKTFISDISHEFKTPIALIQGYAEGLQYSIADEESKNFYCETIIEESQKMNSLVKRLLNLNQIEFGYKEINLKEMDIKEVIDEKLKTMNILFDQNNIKIKTDLNSQIVEMDEELLDEILNNLLSNAIHHISNDKILEITMEELNNEIKIKIFNTGQLIAEDNLDKIWIKFYKEDKARTREYGGSGLGLSIVKAILNSVNQECGCINRENGVEFWFTLHKK